MKTRLFIFFAALLALGACSHSRSEKVEVSQQRYAPLQIREDEPVGNSDVKQVTEEDNSSSQSTSVNDTSKKVTRQGDIKFRTDDVAKTRKAILASLKSAGGYVAEEKEFIDENDSTKNYTLDARIPAKNFDKFLSNVSETAVQIDSKNITTTDVTTQYIDMSTRLRNKKALEATVLGSAASIKPDGRYSGGRK